MWPILVEFRYASSKILQRNKDERKKEEESVVKYKSADRYVGRPNKCFKLCMNNTVKYDFFGFPKAKWLQYTGEVGKCTSYIDVKFSQNSTHQKSLKSVNFLQSCLKIKRWTFWHVWPRFDSDINKVARKLRYRLELLINAGLNFQVSTYFVV